MQWVTLNQRPPDPEFEVLTAQPHIIIKMAQMDFSELEP